LFNNPISVACGTTEFVPLHIKQSIFPGVGTSSGTLTKWSNAIGGILSSIDQWGAYRGPYIDIALSGATTTGYRISPASGVTGWLNISLPRNSGEIALRDQFNWPTQSVTGNYSVQSNDYYIGLNITTSNKTITMPTGISYSGKKFVLKDETGNASTYPIIMSGINGALIDGSNIRMLDQDYISYTLMYRNNGYWII
jgi:hypothetical protein